MSVFQDMVDFIKDANPVKDQIVLCIEGPVGIGKTAAVNQAAKELKEEGLMTGKVVTIIASQILPNEVSGITMPVHESRAMEIYDHYRLSSLVDGDMLFFDELLEADQLVLSACLTLIESRQMMSGRKMPDIQIVAATNATIKPNMLKENIRQRFVWDKFDIDREGCREYIKRMYGFDVGKDVVDQIKATGEEYNILTQRSLTKMAYWMSTAKDERQACRFEATINRIWKSQLGTKLKRAYLKSISDPEMQVRRAIKQVACEVMSKTTPGFLVPDDQIESVKGVSFDNATIPDLISVLKECPEWPEIEARLSKMEMDEPDEADDFSF